jgi:hypothetical protein
MELDLGTRAVPNFSNLHLEVGQQYDTYRIPPNALYLILAGDIGRLIDNEGYLTFLKNHVDLFQPIFLVLGNHEFYGLTLEKGIERAEELQKEESLSNKSYSAASETTRHSTTWDSRLRMYVAVCCSQGGRGYCDR